MIWPLSAVGRGPDELLSGSRDEHDAILAIERDIPEYTRQFAMPGNQQLEGVVIGMKPHFENPVLVSRELEVLVLSR